MNLSKHFIKITLGLIISGVIGILSAGCVPSQTAQNAVSPETPVPKQNTSKANQPPPQLASSHGEQSNAQPSSNLGWRLIDGQTKTLADYRGKAVILDFWATYCPPCEEGIPHLVELSNKYQKDLQVVGLHVGGAEDRANVAGFVTKYRMSYDLGYPQQELSDFYLKSDTRIPQTIVFDRRGNLVQKFVGFTPEIKAGLDAAVEQALQKQ